MHFEFYWELAYAFLATSLFILKKGLFLYEYLFLLKPGRERGFQIQTASLFFVLPFGMCDICPYCSSHSPWSGLPESFAGL